MDNREGFRTDGEACQIFNLFIAALTVFGISGRSRRPKWVATDRAPPICLMRRRDALLSAEHPQGFFRLDSLSGPGLRVIFARC